MQFVITAAFILEHYIGSSGDQHLTYTAIYMYAHDNAHVLDLNKTSTSARR